MAHTGWVWVFILAAVGSVGVAVLIIALMAKQHGPTGGWRAAGRQYLAEWKQRRLDKERHIIRPSDPVLDAEPIDTSVDEIFSLVDPEDEETAYQEVLDVRDVIHDFRVAREHSTAHRDKSTPGQQSSVTPTVHDIPEPDRAPRIPPVKKPPQSDRPPAIPPSK